MTRLLSILLCAVSATATDFVEWGSTRWGVHSPQTVAPWADWSRGTDTGLVLWASFDGGHRSEGTTNVQPDGSRLYNDMKQPVATNSPTITGRVAVFDGTDRMWTTNTRVSVGSNWSVSCWARDNNGNTNVVQTIISDQIQSSGTGWYLGIYQRKFRVVESSSTGLQYKAVNSQIITSGQWYHVVGCYTSGATAPTLWINSTNSGVVELNQHLPNVSSSLSNLIVGARFMALPTNLLVGAIDDLRVMRWTPTPTEITNLYQWTRGASRP